MEVGSMRGRVFVFVSLPFRTVSSLLLISQHVPWCGPRFIQWSMHSQDRLCESQRTNPYRLVGPRECAFEFRDADNRQLALAIACLVSKTASSRYNFPSLS